MRYLPLPFGTKHLKSSMHVFFFNHATQLAGSSLIRDQTEGPAVEERSPDYWTARKFPQRAFYMYSTSQFGLAMFHVLCSHMWLVTTILGSAEIEH